MVGSFFIYSFVLVCWQHEFVGMTPSQPARLRYQLLPDTQCAHGLGRLCRAEFQGCYAAAVH